MLILLPLKIKGCSDHSVQCIPPTLRAFSPKDVHTLFFLPLYNSRKKSTELLYSTGVAPSNGSRLFVIFGFFFFNGFSGQRAGVEAGACHSLIY